MLFEKKLKKDVKGFTLIEILLVIALIAILAGITIIAINPARQYNQSENTQRQSHINSILNAVTQYAVDNNGSVPPDIPIATDCAVSTSYQICRQGVTCSIGVDLSPLTASETYLVSIPVDPESTSTEGTGYNIIKSANGRITVCAPLAELGETISVTR